MSLQQPVPWGRTLAEYRAMFALGGVDDGARVLDVAAGPASFTAEWAANDGRVVACDPLYALDAATIRARLAGVQAAVSELMAANAARFVWRTFPGPGELFRARRGAADLFLADLRRGGVEGRYVAGALPSLPFADRVFGLGLCSHFLFLYSNAFDAAFHVAALTELARVAQEVRVFPLLAMDGRSSPHVAPVTAALRWRGYHVSVERVAYEVLRGGDEMLRLKAIPVT
jgi:ubiquinone/menaquinone biosynthesis C-methylase UbiE